MQDSNPDRRRTVQLSLFALLVAATVGVAAAKTATERGVAPPPPPAGAAPAASPGTQLVRPRIEAVFVLDTTGSMGGLLEGAKQKIWSIANQLANGQPRPEIRVGVVAYRDRGDTYVTQHLDLTEDLDTVYARLRSFRAEGGGDGPESVQQALHEAVQSPSWSQGDGVYRVIFLVGDAPPHLDYQDDVPYARSVDAARARGIVVNTVQCGSETETTGIWRAIARSGQGRFVAIAQDGGVVQLATPMDDELARLNRELAATVLPYGKREAQAEVRGKVDAALAAPAPAAAERLAYLAKSGGRANLGRADLVDAVRDGKVDPRKLVADELPEPLRALAPEARAQVVEQKAQERAEIQRRIGAVAKERDGWLQQEEAKRAKDGAKKGFDAEVLDAIRDQAAKSGVRF
jgi:Mg-chelatase subunit ChlD